MEHSSFFNSVAGDRVYQASDFASFFSSLVTNGVFPNPSTNLQVLSNNNMTASISIGKAWINGYCYLNDSALILPIAVADGVLNRIDRIVLRFDTVGRTITTAVKKGTFATTPVAPVLEQDANYFELGIADILISAGVITITQANITDQRMNTALCGWVNSLIQADTTAIFNQYQAWFTAQSSNYNTQMVANEATFTSQFNTWFATIQSQLSGDIAGNLANQINLVNGKINILNEVSITTNIGNAYSITIPNLTVLTDGYPVFIKINIDSTGPSTLNPNVLGAIPLKGSMGNDITNLKTNGIYTFRYNLTTGNFIMQGEGVDATSLITATNLILGM